MQFVYLCGPDSDEELKYSIRSLIKNVDSPKIILVGAKPAWYLGESILVSQDQRKYDNVHKNLITAIESPIIDDKFVVMNDDFYVMKKVDSFEYAHEGSLFKKYISYQKASSGYVYTKKIKDTHEQLFRMGFSEPLSYELHIPFTVEKQKLSRAMKHSNLLWRSVYGNMFSVGGSQMSDVKVYSESNMQFKSYNYLVEDSEFLSTSDSSFRTVKENILKKLFSEKSYLEA